MTPTKRGRKPAEVREMPPPNGDFTPKPPETPVPESTEAPQSSPRGMPAPKKFDLPPEDLFRYYREMDAAFPGRLSLYVYRTLPVTDVTQPLSEEELRLIQQKKKKEPAKNICIEKTCPVKDAADWNLWVCETFGAGDYHFKLNDQHPSVKKTIAMTTTKGEGSLRAWNSFPPLLHCNEAGEVDQVVLNDPLNESYVRWARLNSIKFAGDTQVNKESKQEEDNEMASVVETMARQNSELTDKVVQMAQSQRPTVNGTPPVDPAARAQMGGVETVVEASKQGMKIMGDAMQQVLGSHVKAADPHEQLKHSIEIAKLLTPAAPAGNGMEAVVKMMELQLVQTREQAKSQLEQQEKSFTRLLDMQRESHKETVSMLTSRLDSLEKSKTESHDPQVNALKAYKEIRAIVKDIEDDEAPPEENEPAWMKFGGKVLDGVGEFMRNAAAMRAAQPPPPPIVDVNPGLPQPPAPAAPTQQEQEMNMMQHYAKQIHKPLVDAIKQGQPGYDFAAAIISNAGQGPYDQLAGGGYNGITKFLQCYQPLWNELILPPIGGPLLDKFVGEFLDREKVMQSLQMAKGQPPRKGPTVNQ